MKLSESQSKIYKNDKILLELNEKNLVLKKEAAQSLKEKNTGKAEELAIKISKNSLKASAIISANIDLALELEKRRSVLQNQIISSSKEKASAIAEIEAHSKLVSQYEQGLKQEAQAKKQKQDKIYKEEKAKLYNTASNFIKDPASLNNILTPLAQKKGSKESVGVGDVASSGLSALSFAVKNIGSVIDVVGSISFYKEEAEKIPMGKGVKEEASFLNF